MATPKPDFTDARLKLDRAGKHIADVKATINSFLATDFYRLRVETDEREVRTKVFFDSLHQPDKALNAIIGDAIGNLRSVLDYAAIALASPITGKTDATFFPFADDAKGFAGKVRAAKGLGPCDVAIQKHFIDEVQAYKDGNGHTLWVLNNLRNIDKHRLLIATAQIAAVRAPFVDQNGNQFLGTYGVTAGQSGLFVDAPANHIKFTEEPQAIFEIRLQEPRYIEDASVTAFLEKAASDTESLLNSLKVFA